MYIYVFITNIYQYISLVLHNIIFFMKLLIWQERTKRGVTLRELSMRTGISKSALDNYENGIRCPNMNQMELIAKALDTSISNLYESQYK